jgi:hypothetical protein
LLKEYAQSGPIVYIIKVKSYENGQYIVHFDDVTTTLSYCELVIYFDCDNCVNQTQTSENNICQFLNII